MAHTYRKVAVAGTFNSLHCGHASLLDKAFAVADRVIIGVTTDAFAERLKGAAAKPRTERVRAITALIGDGNAARAEFIALDDPFGPALSADAGIQALVVSTETLPRAEEISRLRAQKGMAPLDIIAVPLAYAEDLKKIGSTRIRRRSISRRGRRLTPVRIAVGTANPSKLRGVREVCKKIFHTFVLIPLAVDSRVPSQPFEAETLHGAINRAIAARRDGRADYGVGLESGVFEVYGRHFDIQWCAVYDGENVTLGSSMGFEVPREIMELVKHADSADGSRREISEAFHTLTGKKDVGKKQGILGFLSRGLAKRADMSRQAFLCAMVPRLNRLNYRKCQPVAEHPFKKAYK